MPSPQRHFRFSRPARADIREATAYYASQHPSLPDRFRAAIARAIDAVVERPESFPVIHADLRRAMLKTFPYGVFFRAVGSRIRIVGVIHLHRDPVTWQRRASD